MSLPKPTLLLKLQELFAPILSGKWVYRDSLKHIRPYLELMRLHQPTGIWLLLFPSWWAILLADSRHIHWFTLLLFALGAIIMRGAGCVINDIVDRKLDAQVERTKNRPLASGTLSVSQAHRLLAILLLLGLGILALLPLTAILLGVAILIPVIAYPFMKRYTYWPQLFLGLTFNWGALMGGAAILNYVPISSYLLYIACVCWTLGYDTIYAHQDKQDDLKAGIKSTAIAFGDKTERYLQSFYGTAGVFWGIAGLFSGLSMVFALIWVGACYHLYAQILDTDLNDPADCNKTFRSNINLGWILTASYFFGVLLNF